MKNKNSAKKTKRKESHVEKVILNSETNELEGDGLRRRVDKRLQFTDDGCVTRSEPKTPERQRKFEEAQTPSHGFCSPKAREVTDTEFSFPSFSLRNYLMIELMGIGSHTVDNDIAAVAKIRNFVWVPLMLELFLFLGFFVCLDAFLYIVAYLPVRVVSATCLMIYESVIRMRRYVLRLPPVQYNGKFDFVSSGMYFHRTHAYDLMRGMITVAGCVALHFINMGQLYHYIRGQTTVKLYVLTGMLEVLDRLFGSFGQDSFASLYAQTKVEPTLSKLFFPFLITAIYVVVHSGIYFVHIATLTVAINSSDQALISVFILNNFAEFKSFVFKKFDTLSLFQLSCSDITERFKMLLFLFLITVVSISQSGSASAAYEILQAHGVFAVYMMMGEMAADWTKHAFIAKFNTLDSTCYEIMSKVLRRDVLHSQKDTILLDHTFYVTRRIGISQIPLVCVAIRYFELALQSIECQNYIKNQSFASLLSIALSVFIGLLLTKSLLGISLLFYSGRIHNEEVRKKRERQKQSESKEDEDATSKRANNKQIGDNKSNNGSNSVSGKSNNVEVNNPLTFEIFQNFDEKSQFYEMISSPKKKKYDNSELKDEDAIVNQLSGVERYSIIQGKVVG